MKVRLHPRAQRDLAEIRNYLRKTAGAKSAERVRAHLRARILGLGRTPQLGVAGTEPGIRVLSPSRYPYRIYFTNTDDTVVVLHVRHTSRRLPEPGDLA